MSNPSSPSPAGKLTGVQWLICSVAALGFAFDIYELLMMPLIARNALAELLKVDPLTDSGFNAIKNWTGYILYASAVCGGVFGLLGGYLTDRYGRRKVLVWSILLYAFSAAAAGFSTTPMMLLVLRCTTFVGVCVEFVAAVAWLAELFPNPKQRETVLGYTQAFSSIGGLMVTGAYFLINRYVEHLPDIFGDGKIDTWRYTLISGLIPAIPLIVIRPFLPESPAWAAKKEKGTLKRPSFAQLFQPQFRRTTLVTALMFACSYGAAFGAIQLAPQIVPGLDTELPKVAKLRKDYEAAQKAGTEDSAVAAQAPELKKQIVALGKRTEELVSGVQFWQEMGGLAGRFALAALAIWIVSRRNLMRVFQIPGLIVIPLVFLYPATNNLELFRWGMAFAGFCTVAQFSFWGNYLPRVYPVHLRGTGESFAANVGGRMLGTMATLFSTQLADFMPGKTPPTRLAYAAAATAFGVYLLGSVACFFLPEPPPEDEHE